MIIIAWKIGMGKWMEGFSMFREVVKVLSYIRMEYSKNVCYNFECSFYDW